VNFKRLHPSMTW